MITKIFFICFILFFTSLIPTDAFGEVPEWIKNMVKWYSEDKISEHEFLGGLKYLIENKILLINDSIENDLIRTFGITEIEFKTYHFKDNLKLKGISVVLLADTAEIQAIVKMLELKEYGQKVSDEQLKNNLSDKLISVLDYQHDLDQIRILDLKGFEVFRANVNDGIFEVVSEDELQDKSGRYYFHELLKLKADDVYFSDIDLNEENGMIETPYKPTIRIGTMIHDSNHERLGYLIINYKTEKMLENVGESKFCNIVVFDQDGTIIQHNNKSLTFGKQLGSNTSYYQIQPQFEYEEEKHEEEHREGSDVSPYWYYDSTSKSTIIFSETEPHGADRYWHFVCEIK